MLVERSPSEKGTLDGSLIMSLIRCAEVARPELKLVAIIWILQSVSNGTAASKKIPIHKRKDRVIN